jgi:hypothetical protein
MYCGQNWIEMTQGRASGKDFSFIFFPHGSRGSLVGIATDYGLGDRGVGIRVPVGSRIFSTSSRPAMRPTQPPIQWVPGLKGPGHEADHSFPTIAEVKETWIYTTTPPYAFMA